VHQCRLVKKILSVILVLWCLGGRKKAPQRHQITMVSQSIKVPLSQLNDIDLFMDKKYSARVVEQAKELEIELYLQLNRVPEGLVNDK
jgi:hypothetical protein